MPEFKLLQNGIQDRFLRSRAKIQIFGGGFGNGKTTAAVVKTLQIANDYPGANILMARATFPKLNDTLRKEFIKWCPKDAIERFPMSVNESNTCTLKNRTMVNFRYIAQQGKSQQATTSNLLSATFDLCVVDQMEDPEISYKDFLDLLGRLRGNAPYHGSDLTMPMTGPRWMFITLNPTRNWIYKKLVAPYHLYQASGIITDDLLCVRDVDNKPVLQDGKPILMMELVEGGTEANAHNLPADFITTMASAYTGQMRDRFLKGEWAAYEGLVYPAYNQLVHNVSRPSIVQYLAWLENNNYDVEWIESYDFGLASPSCYTLGFVDHCNNVVCVDGFYRTEMDLADQANEIRRIRREWASNSRYIYADPDIFRRKGSRGERISDKLWMDYGISVVRADNDITSGIAKVASYLVPREQHVNPFTKDTPAPMIYFNEEMSWVDEEFGGYFWKTNAVGDRIDEPSSTAMDHFMDSLKYLMTNRPPASKLRPRDPRKKPAFLSWHERDVMSNTRGRTHGG